MSVLEAIERFERLTGWKLSVEYDERARVGDYICYISNLQRFRRDYPRWEPVKSLDDMFPELVAGHGEARP